MTPQLFCRILAFVRELRAQHLDILSTIRLTLYNASNELDNPDCIQLRRLLSEYVFQEYGFPLGAISSDVAFHVSGTQDFEANLHQLLGFPTLWDNLCFSIDEQIPVGSAAGYSCYLDALRRVWDLLLPALTGQLRHARSERRGAPRVILNMLVPEPGAHFRQEHQEIYSGGPSRSLHFETLVERYVKPFVGDIVETVPGLPSGHRFTSSIARLSLVPGSSVYLAYNRYASTGRGGKLVRFERAGIASPPKIVTKLYPAGPDAFRFRATFTSAPYADDEIRLSDQSEPEWFGRLANEVIRA